MNEKQILKLNFSYSVLHIFKPS